MTQAQHSAYSQADTNAYHQMAYREHRAHTPVDGLPSSSVHQTVAEQIERVQAGHLGFAPWAVY